MPFTGVPGCPVCLGIVDAAPYAQGAILVRWYEACPYNDDYPIWRYEFHVKRAADGPLTPAEINAKTYYARSLRAEGITCCEPMSPCLGSPCASSPGVLMAGLAFEAPESVTPPVVAGDGNMHLFSNQQYYIAVRAIALDPVTNVTYEDDNEEIELSYSTGYQGVVWQHILSWPCLELCAGQSIAISALPAVEFADGAELDMRITAWPELGVHMHRKGG